MGAFSLGAIAAPVAGNLADHYRAHRSLAPACAALCAASLWLFPLAAAPLQPLLGLANGAGFAGAVTVANLLIVERHPRAEWNTRLGWLETALSFGQGGGLVLAAWLSGLTARNGLLIAALVPVAAIPLSLTLIPRMSGTAAAARPAPAAPPGAGASPGAATGPGAAPSALGGASAGGVGGASALRPRARPQFPSPGPGGEWGPGHPPRRRPPPPQPP